MKLTKPLVAKLRLPPGKLDQIVFDDLLPGFGIRLRAGGKRTWVVQYRVGRKQRRLTFGNAGMLDPEAARTQARKLLAKVGLAIDPQAEKVLARSEATLTLGRIVDRYLEARRNKLRPRSFAEVERHLHRDWSPLHGLPLNGIGRSDVAARLGALVKETGPVAADRARSALSALFTWSMKEGIAVANPVIATNRPSEPVARERVLSASELADVWNACGEDDYGRIVRLLVLTGQRREEVAGIRWSEIDLEEAMWSLPGLRTKNGRPHDVPLSRTAMKVIRSVPRRAGRDLIFGQGDGPFSGWSKAKTELDDRIASARRDSPGRSPGSGLMPGWRLHDLRRTAVTGMATIGIAPHIVEAVVNHLSGSRAGVAGVYNRATYAPEKRAAMERWAEQVEVMVSRRAAKIVALRRN